jgi:hypothetical protein
MQDLVQQRLNEEITLFVANNARWIVLFAVCISALFVTMSVIFALALIAAIFHGDKPCDQPLKYYMFIVILWHQMPSKLAEYLSDRLNLNPGQKASLILALALPSWALLGWGIYMVRSAKTCPKTNPDLYYPTEHYIYAEVVLCIIAFVATICTLCGLRRFVLFMSSLIRRPGCVEAVQQLPKIEPGSPELIDEGDGEVRACSICLDALSAEGIMQRTPSTLSEGNQVSTTNIVRTPCQHYFHEDCLVKWCKNHMDCPLCRKPIGEPDPDPESGIELDQAPTSAEP